ncbi:hypothetical protein SD70_00195 [Gordoniibacillus kamchatkensis]|uniref:ABC transporter permease n=1 Tax=Gordoniibacillus kamchatkensis TaxID=1590651 RepID=A0ABR5AN53_9BACL|nr:DUF6526 family protein [Paenibacillus sp. VKM B-2647]KIL42397.1 hypothetical protein SD70_00195 [Paenibacillus sp. VKM B-2647]
MKQQSYKNHVRLHPLFHFLLVPLSALTVIGSLLHIFPKFRGSMDLWYAIVLLMASVALAIAAVLTREYAKKVQDRVIRSEENFRHYVLTGHLLDPSLTLSQIIALRFASDEQFPELCSRAAQDHLSPDDIKRSIKTWRPDYLRV